MLSPKMPFSSSSAILAWASFWMAPKPFCVAVQKFAVKWPTGARVLSTALFLSGALKQMTPDPERSRTSLRGRYSCHIVLMLRVSQ